MSQGVSPTQQMGLRTLGTEGHSGAETGPFTLRAVRPARAECGLGPAWPATRPLTSSQIEATIWFQSRDPDSGFRLQPASKFTSLATPASSPLPQDPGSPPRPQHSSSDRETEEKKTDGRTRREGDREEGRDLPARPPPCRWLLLSTGLLVFCLLSWF